MPEREIPTTRIALLELKEEQQLVKEGYSLLDEKRILLAAEIRRELERLRVRRAQMAAAEEAARAAVVAALLRRGLDTLAVHPPDSLADLSLAVERTRLLGLQLIDATVKAADVPAAQRPRDGSSDAIRECVRAHRVVLASAVALAACSLNLRRLVREYVRTERRTRAIENILLPEINAAVKLLEEQLDSMDLEELARLRGRCALRAGLATTGPARRLTA